MPCDCEPEIRPAATRPGGFRRRVLGVLCGGRPPGNPGCVYLPERVVNRPDPCIYSQFLLMRLGQPVTWDNPDVRVLREGSEVDSFGLLPGTLYQIEVTVHNASRRKPATGTSVRLGWIEFGAGSEIRHLIDSSVVDVGVWPATAITTFAWTTPIVPGHYCLEVELAHPDDGNPENNRGWNNTQVVAAHSQVRTTIRVFNKWPRGCPSDEDRRAPFEWPLVAGALLIGATIGLAYATLLHHGDEHGIRHAWRSDWFTMLGIGAAAGVVVGLLRFVIATRQRASMRHERETAEPWRRRERVPCELVTIGVDSYTFEDGVGKDVNPTVMFAPRPPASPAWVEPSTFRFEDGEPHRDVILIVDAPEGPGPAETFNVSILQGHDPSGGVTVRVVREA